jgi:hypothetical protein
MLLRKMKSVIKYAIELDIDYLETFLGYEGDNVLKITTKSQVTIDLLKKYLDNIDLEYKTDYALGHSSYTGYSLFVGVEDPSLFKLKRD